MTKRSYGLGSIYKRGRIWWLKYYVEGQARYESARTGDRREAHRLLKQRLAEVVLDQLPSPSAESGLLIADLLETLARDYRMRNRASLSQLESRMKRHLIPALGKLLAGEFRPMHIESYIRRRRDEGASDTSINRELEHLRAAFRMAVEERKLLKAPRVRMLAQDNVRTGFIEHFEYEALRRALPAYLVPLFVTAYHLGCRLGELLKLTWSQIDLNACQIWLHARQTRSRTARLLPIYGDMREVLSVARSERDRS